MDQTKIQDAIKSLYEKYKDNPFMTAKTDNFICQQLPVILQNIEKTHVEQAQRITELNTEQDAFIQTFLANNRYFYVSNTDNFFYYDGTNFVNVTEDEVIHNVLTSISRDRSLMSWKYKTKSAIMKRIRDYPISACIPESSTIQAVLNYLYPAIFATKIEAKYFLTILGDNILKKNAESVIHILNPSAKTFINSLNAACQMWFGVNLNQSFKYKYHADHVYNQMRILSTVPNIPNGKIHMDFLCVACHYSNRYLNSDNYIVKYCNDDKLTESVFFLKNISPETLVGMFVGEYLTSGTTGTSSSNAIGTSVHITWKNMLYLWKHFLEAKLLPNVVTQSRLKNSLINQFTQHYSEVDDLFMGMSSKYLPTVCQFLRFWDETMVPDETEIEIEIGELAMLFRRRTDTNIGEKQIVNILSHFFPDLEIDQDKYIYKMRSRMWDKQVDIMMAMREQETISTYDVYDAYVNYCNYMNRSTTGVPMLVSKQYFEKCMTLISVV